jgi:hypothetical protein
MQLPGSRVIVASSALLVTSALCVACGASNASTSVTCSPGRTVLDGVCVSEQVADYVACVRAQGAQLGSAESQRIASEVGAYGVKAGGAYEVSQELEKKYSVSDAATLAVIETCNRSAGLGSDRTGGAELLRGEREGTRYARVERTMAWPEARDQCKQLGAQLVSITSADENAFVYDTFGKTAVIWLGASDEGHEGTFTWVSGEPFAFSSWAQGEPNNAGGAEHHVTMGDLPSKIGDASYRFGSTWNDIGAAGEYSGQKIAKPVCEWRR